MNEEEAVKRLEQILAMSNLPKKDWVYGDEYKSSYQNGGYEVGAHIESDAILLEFVPKRIRELWEQIPGWYE